MGGDARQCFRRTARPWRQDLRPTKYALCGIECILPAADALMVPTCRTTRKRTAACGWPGGMALTLSPGCDELIPLSGSARWP